MDSHTEFALVELSRRLENMIRIGTIADVDPTTARVRVKYAEDESGNPVKTDWCPWLTRRAGSDVDWWVPELNEQVILVSPSGDLSLAVVLPSIYQSAHPAPSSNPDVHRTQYGDGSFTEYNRTTHKLSVTVNGGDVVINTTGNLDAAIGGNADVIAGGSATIQAGAGITLDGAGGSSTKGIIQGDCLCAFTGAPHPQMSSTVKGSK